MLASEHAASGYPLNIAVPVLTLQADGLSVGIPPTLYDVSPQAQQLVQLVAAVQAETFTYARCGHHVRIQVHNWNPLRVWGCFKLLRMPCRPFLLDLTSGAGAPVCWLGVDFPGSAQQAASSVASVLVFVSRLPASETRLSLSFLRITGPSFLV